MGFARTTSELVSLLLEHERTKIINVIVCLREDKLRAYVFPRWTRLPLNYAEHFKDADKTIKPGHSEMAGYLVTVDRDIYDFSTADNVKEALGYVSSTADDLAVARRHFARGLRDEREELQPRHAGLVGEIDELWERGIKAGFVREECRQSVENKSYEDGLIEVQLNEARKSIVSFQRVAKRQKGEEQCPYCIAEEGRIDHAWNGYVISANPYPYYDHHIVIVNGEHVHQYIDEAAIRTAMDFVLAAPDYMVTYNGPPGTTILGHMHFQAGIHSLPVERAATEVIAETGALCLRELKGFPSRGFVVEKLVSQG